MKSLNPRLFSLSLMSVVLLFSCKKYDLKEQLATENTETTASTIGLKASSWKTLSDWNQVEQPSYNLYYTSIKDENITSDIANKGVVLVYKKTSSNNSLVQLPYEEKIGNTTYYWYYQISNGKVLVSCDIYGSANKEYISNSNSFKYVPVTIDALNQLEGKGYSRVELMKMPYEQVATMTNGTLK